MYIPESVIEEIRNRLDIADLISPHVQLKRAGSSLKGLCPFHLEKTPSFHVNTARQFFHCFGCGVSGDVFTFVMKFESLDFVDAVKKLGRMAGVEVHEEQKDSPESRRRKDLLSLQETAAKWFHERLLGKEGRSCRDYLKRRGIEEKTIETFQLGFAPDTPSMLCRHLENKHFSEGLALESGLLFRSRRGTVCDRFRDRLMFPIYDASSRVVGFSGRILPSSESDTRAAKYVNSPESPIFRKNRLLYGMHLARQEIGREGWAILAEGHLDVCMLHQAGFSRALGVQGTAFSEEHARWISRYAKSIHIVFDGDEAGTRAALRILPIALSREIYCFLVRLPEKEDPASLLRNQSGSILAKLMENAPSLFEFKIEHLREGRPLTPELKVSITEAMLEDLSGVSNPVLADSLIQVAASRLDIDTDSVRRQWREKRGRTTSSSAYARRPVKHAPETAAPKLHSRLSAPERHLIEVLMNGSDARRRVFEAIDFDWLRRDEIRQIVDRMFRLHCEKSFSLENVLDAFLDDPDKADLVRWAARTDFGENLHRAIEDTLKSLEIEHHRGRLSELNRELQDRVRSKRDYRDLLSEIDALTRTLRGME
jgi:DNA primase